jgi:hypothetical protein
MCNLCGCKTYIDSGKQAVVARAREIVKQLKLNRDNVQLFEDSERILHEVYSYSYASSDESELLGLSRWVHQLHEPIYKERLPKYLEAAKDVFARLPVKGKARDIVTMYHQLEQLAVKIDEEELASIQDPNVRETLKAMCRVHEANLGKKSMLKERYGLE